MASHVFAGPMPEQFGVSLSLNSFEGISLTLNSLSPQFEPKNNIWIHIYIYEHIFVQTVQRNSFYDRNILAELLCALSRSVFIVSCTALACTCIMCFYLRCVDTYCVPPCGVSIVSNLHEAT